MKTNNKVIALLGAVLILVAAACGSRNETASGSDEGGGGGAAAGQTPTIPPAANQEDLAELCTDFEDDSSYLPGLPGPTPGSAGAAFTSSDEKAAVVGATVTGIVADYVATPVASAHWGEIDRGAILGSTDPHSPANTEAEATRLRNNEAAREEGCQNLALELSNAFNDETVVMNLTPSIAEARNITQLAFWVYDPEYKTSGWLCGQAVPPEGIKLVAWKRSFSEGGSPLGETVAIAYERRELVAFDCPGQAFTGTQEGPEKVTAPETSVPNPDQDTDVPESSQPAPDVSQPTANEEAGNETAAGPATNPPSGGSGAETPVTTPSGGGDTGTNPGPGGSGGQPGGGTNECTGQTGPSCPGSGPGGGGGQENPCVIGCPGGGQPTPTTPCVICVPETQPPPPETQPPPPVTQPPVTQPPVTQPPVTQPPVTQPPPAKDPAPTCFTWVPWPQPGACPP